MKQKQLMENAFLVSLALCSTAVIGCGELSLPSEPVATVQSAIEAPCEEVCGWCKPCDTPCSMPNWGDPEPPTCGNAIGWCGPDPNFYETGRTRRGRFQKEWPFYCEIWEVYTIHERNSCGDTRDRCDDLFTGDRSWGFNDCCVDHGCSGQQFGC